MQAVAAVPVEVGAPAEGVRLGEGVVVGVPVAVGARSGVDEGIAGAGWTRKVARSSSTMVAKAAVEAAARSADDGP